MVERHQLATRTQEENASDDRTTEEIRQDIAARRESITETVDKLSVQVQRTLDWRAYVADYPFVATGLAAGVGFMLAGVFRPRPTPGERLVAALSETVEDVTGRLRGQFDGFPSGQKNTHLSIQSIAGAIATKAVMNYFNNKLLVKEDAKTYSDASNKVPREAGNRTESFFRSSSGIE